MGLFDRLQSWLRSPPTEPGDPAQRATPASDPDRMYATPASSDASGDGDAGPANRDGRPSGPPELFAYEAEECADFWAEYDLDFTTDSLTRLDDAVAERFGEDQFVGVEPDPSGDGDARSFDRIVQSFGSYLGETLVRDCDAEWRHRDEWVVVDSTGTDAIRPFAVTVDVFRSERAFTSAVELDTDG